MEKMQDAKAPLDRSPFVQATDPALPRAHDASTGRRPTARKLNEGEDALITSAD